jgi:hypothetical protein
MRQVEIERDEHAPVFARTARVSPRRFNLELFFIRDGADESGGSTYEFMAHFGDIGYADSGLGEAIDGYFGTGVNQTTPSRQQIADTCQSPSYTTL